MGTTGLDSMSHTRLGKLTQAIVSRHIVLPSVWKELYLEESTGLTIKYLPAQVSPVDCKESFALTGEALVA